LVGKSTLVPSGGDCLLKVKAMSSPINEKVGVGQIQNEKGKVSCVPPSPHTSNIAYEKKQVVVVNFENILVYTNILDIDILRYKIGYESSFFAQSFKLDR